MSRNDYLISAIFLIAILFFLFGAVTASICKTEQMEDRAVKKGFAEYTTDSGTFKWTNKDVEYILKGK